MTIFWCVFKFLKDVIKFYVENSQENYQFVIKKTFKNTKLFNQVKK